MSQTLKIFKLLYSGGYEDISENIIESFSAVSVLSIYVGLQKILYTWIGSHASRTLINYIGQMRERFSRDYLDLRVLRYITVESKAESFEFFANTGINKEKLHQRIQNHENKLLPVLEEINDLKSKQDKLFEAEEYDDAIELAKEIIELAKKIDDPLLEKDQEDFISGAKYRTNLKEILFEIEKESEIIKEKIKKSHKPNEIIELHKYVEEIKQKYTVYIDVTELDDFRKLLAYEETIWQDFSAKLKDFEKLSKLEERIKETIEQNNLKASLEILKEAKKVIEPLKDEESTKKWNKIEEEYNEKWKTFSNRVAELEELFGQNQKEENYSAIIKICEKLIEIGESYKDDDLVDKYKQFLEEYGKKLKEFESKKQEILELKAKEFDDLKEIISELRIKAKKALDKGLIIQAYETYNEITKRISDHNKR
ncbi:MAG: hypothetical protein ACFFAH_06340 [Promethearchaeota archaeon]